MKKENALIILLATSIKKFVRKTSSVHIFVASISILLFLMNYAYAMLEPYMVKDINPNGSSNISYMKVSGDWLFFQADDGINGRALWKSDGTAAGTVMVKDINKDFDWKEDFGPKNLRDVNGTLFFASGNRTVEDSHEGGYPKIYHNIELWKSNGTAAGTVMVKDIYYDSLGWPHESSNPSNLRKFNNKLLFTARSRDYGRELWISDGTTAGTVMVKDIIPGSDGSFPQNLRVGEDIVCFTIQNDFSGDELWKTDGTSAGTEMIKDTGGVFTGFSNLIIVNGTLFFAFRGKLWKSDGTAAGTVILNPTVLSPAGLKNLNNILFFKTAGKLWKSDGTEEGTVVVKQFSDNSFPYSSFYNINGMLYFWTSDLIGNGIRERKIWKSDGTEEGTVVVATLYTNSGVMYSQLIALGSMVYFKFDDETNGFELWKTDGTEEGTMMAYDINPNGNSHPSSFVKLNNTIFFRADDGTNGAELWAFTPCYEDIGCEDELFCNGYETCINITCVHSGDPCNTQFVCDEVLDVCLSDLDSDMIEDNTDNCPYYENPNQEDIDEDGMGDACDNCPEDNNTNQSDFDYDGIGDACDSCPNDPGYDIDNDTLCGNVDVCPSDPTNDTDNDSVCGLSDNCPDTPNGIGLGNCIRQVSGVFIGTGNVCEDFQDCEEGEYCQLNQEDFNDNGIGDACECYADCNNDTKVGILDLLIMKNEYSRNDCELSFCEADLNDDDEVNIYDLIVMKAQYNIAGCPVAPDECPSHGLVNCGGICVDNNTDESNCGTCGNVCQGGKVCCFGLCVDSCPQQQFLEVDVSGGPSAISYPVTELSSPPPLVDDYKTTKILLQKIDVSGTPFTMGSPDNETGRKSNETQHKVTLTKYYYMGVFEITQRQYEIVMGTNPSNSVGDMRPVEMVSWEMIRGGDWPGSPAGSGQPAANSFIGNLRKKTGLDFDLPTDAQWEYAARATTIRAFNDYTKNGGEGADCTVPSDGADPNLEPLGRYRYNNVGRTSKHTVVGSYQPNLWGLFDMHGNVYEWTLDWSGNYNGDETDPLGPPWSMYRVTRGGSFSSEAMYCRSAFRNIAPSSNYSGDLSFRLCLPN